MLLNQMKERMKPMARKKTLGRAIKEAIKKKPKQAPAKKRKPRLRTISPKKKTDGSFIYPEGWNKSLKKKRKK